MGISRWLGRQLSSLLPESVVRALIIATADQNPGTVMQALGPKLNRSPDLDHMPFDLPPERQLKFENLAGLFASTSLDHGVASMTVRQAAYLFGLVQRLEVEKIIEVGRYKGGSTVLLAAALNGRGQLWSIDNGEKEVRLKRGEAARRPYDVQIEEFCARHGFHAELICGNSRTVEVDTGEVDLVFIDGDHTYEGAKIDFERFGRRVRIGGAVLFDDAFAEAGLQDSHSDTVGELVREIIASGEFRLVKAVNRLAHLERAA